MTTTKKKAASRGRAKRPDTTRSPRCRQSTPSQTRDALHAIVGKLRDMSAVAASDIARRELATWMLDDAHLWVTGAKVTDADLIDRLRKMLRLAQSTRHASGDPDQCDFYRIAWACISMAELRWPDDPATVAIWAKISAVKEREGLTEDDCWPTGEGPADYQKLDQQSSDRYDQLVIDTMLMMGERDMAALYRDDRDTFDQRFEQGQAILNPAAAEAMAGTPGLAK